MGCPFLAPMGVLEWRSCKSTEQFELDALVKRLDTLPPYARPLFLRLTHEIDATETFKPKRRIYLEQGFDASVLRIRFTFLNTSDRPMCPSMRSATKGFETGPCDFEGEKRTVERRSSAPGAGRGSTVRLVSARHSYVCSFEPNASSVRAAR